LPATQLKNLALTLFEIGAVRFGDFTLHSGRPSPIYLDLRLLVSFPDALRQVASAYRPLLEPLTFDLIAATPLSGLPIATAVSLDLNIPLIYPRGSAKAYGTGRVVEGKWSPGQTVVLLDDVITSGDSLIQAASQLEEVGLLVKETTVLIDRQQGGSETLASRGYTLHASLTISRLLTILEDQGLISSRQKAEVQQALFGSRTE